LAAAQGIAVDEVATAGVGLAFVVYPQVINAFPFWNSLFGVLFFGSLLFAGFTSAISILEPVVAGVREKFNLSRKSAVNWVCGFAFLVGLVYTTSGGLRYLDVVDHFTNQYGIVLGGVFEVILIAWVAKKLDEFREHANGISYVRLGSWWDICLRWITPVLLSGMLLMTLLDEFSQPYEGYPHSGLIAFGWCVLGIIMVGALYFTKFRQERGNA
jgi:NSS family neurotransmitter:Na+ symporter